MIGGHEDEREVARRTLKGSRRLAGSRPSRLGRIIKQRQAASDPGARDHRS
jgi:hypothetical protein